MTWQVDREEVRRFHREIQGDNPHTRRRDTVTLVSGLASLAEQGYVLDDIGVMLGITRERVRQLYRQHQLSRPYSQVRGRAWDDDLNRFVAVRYVEWESYRTAARRQVRHERLQLRRQAMVECLALLAQDLGRTPTLQEFCERYRGKTTKIEASGAVLASLWRSREYKEMTAELYRRAGLQVRDVGGTGHRTPCIDSFTAERLRAAGKTYQEIATLLGCTESGLRYARRRGSERPLAAPESGVPTAPVPLKHPSSLIVLPRGTQAVAARGMA